MSTNNGLGFFGLLQVAFIVLKLTGYIAWSWWLVMSPFIFVVLMNIIFVGIYIAFLENKRER